MNNDYDIILFDLDGTITDSKLGITKSVQYSLKYFGIVENDLNKLDKFVGPPLMESFQVYYKFDEIKATEAMMKYREYYKVKGIFENEVYQRIPELLEELIKSGKKLILATSKPTVFAEEILEYFDLYKYFSFVAGSNLDGTRVNKCEVIAFALKNCEWKNLDKIVMIGDRKHDIIGARQVGIASIGVLYGYGSREEMEEEAPTNIVESVEGLKKLLLK